jgi:kinesin light chain
MIQLGSYLQTIEAEKQRIKSQVKRLCQENAWLRDELAATQKKLQDSETYSAQIEVELSHLKFLKEIKKYDEDLVSTQVGHLHGLIIISIKKMAYTLGHPGHSPFLKLQKI